MHRQRFHPPIDVEWANRKPRPDAVGNPLEDRPVREDVVQVDSFANVVKPDHYVFKDGPLRISTERLFLPGITQLFQDVALSLKRQIDFVLYGPGFFIQAITFDEEITEHASVAEVRSVGEVTRGNTRADGVPGQRFE